MKLVSYKSDSWNIWLNKGGNRWEIFLKKDGTPYEAECPESCRALAVKFGLIEYPEESDHLTTFRIYLAPKEDHDSSFLSLPKEVAELKLKEIYPDFDSLNADFKEVMLKILISESCFEQSCAWQDFLSYSRNLSSKENDSITNALNSGLNTIIKKIYNQDSFPSARARVSLWKCEK